MPGLMSRCLFLMVLLGFVVVRVAFRRRAGQDRSAVKPARERWLTRAVAAAVILPAVGWLGTPALGFADLPLPEALGWIGYVTALLGVGLLAWAQFTLGANFSPWLEIRNEHGLTTEGPYRWVRHPIYKEGFVIILGCGLLTANALVLLCPTTMFLVLLVFRLPDEEAMLERQFEEEYRAWARRTGRLMPRLRLPSRD